MKYIVDDQREACKAEVHVHNLDRRSFLEASCAGISIAAMLAAADVHAQSDEVTVNPTPRSPLKKTYRAAAIGSTGHGDFGHGLDVALVNLPGVKFVAIADDNPAGLKEAGKRCGIERLYGDYRRMLDTEQIDLVCVGMRHTDKHEEVLVHCAQAGKHIYCEKPVAARPGFFRPHRGRLRTECREARGSAAQSRLACRSASSEARSRESHRTSCVRFVPAASAIAAAAARIMFVLGYHNLDLMCLFAGQPQWTFAHVMQGNVRRKAKRCAAGDGAHWTDRGRLRRSDVRFPRSGSRLF